MHVRVLCPVSLFVCVSVCVCMLVLLCVPEAGVCESSPPVNQAPAVPHLLAHLFAAVLMKILTVRDCSFYQVDAESLHCKR